MRSIAVIALFAGLSFGCDKTQQSATNDNKPAGSASTTGASTGSSTIHVSGSSALQPLVNAAKEKFEAAHKGMSVEVSAGGSNKGLTDAQNGAVEIGDSDVFADPAKQKDLVDHKVATVGFAAMANKGPYNEKVTALTMDQMAKIFTGELKSWKDVGGDAVPFVIVNRAAGSGTRKVFGSLVLGGDKFAENETEDNSGALVTKLKQEKGAISYLALSFKSPDLWVASVKKDTQVIEPSDANIEAGTYPIWSYEHMYTKGEAAAGLTKDFLDYMLSADFQKNVLPTVKGFIPVSEMKVTRDHD